MAFWRRITGFWTGSNVRQRGLQLGMPGAYTRSSAAVVNQDTALQLSAVWACVRLISEAVAGLPLTVYKKERDGSRTHDAQHPLQALFDGKVNRYQDRLGFFETMTMNLAMSGNAYALITREGSRIVSLMPLMSSQVEVSILEDGSVAYQYTDGTNVAVYAEESIWHVKLFGNGVIGLSPLAYARNSIGIGIAAEDRVSSIYANGAKPSGVLMIDKALKAEQREQIKANFAEMREGGADRLFVLEAGMQYQQISMTPQDIELLASRRFQIEDVARFFGVPSVLINDTSGTTGWGSGIQQIVQGWYKLGLRPYLERYEASAQMNLLPADQRRQYEIEFDFQALLRPDEAERVKSYGEGVQRGIYTPNEARLREGLAPITGGDELFMQQQMTPIRNLGRTGGPINGN